MSLYRTIVTIAALSTGLWANAAYSAPANCTSASDRACIANRILADADSIIEETWRDQTLRNAASSLTYDGRIDDAIALIPKIKNPDTKAMTIRAIGMAASLYGHDTPVTLRAIFIKLDKAARTITQPDANAIAYTYIAMAQAFGGLDEDAWVTAASMSNAALKHKAFGETAEIQAERGDLAAAMKSIGYIDIDSYRNKAYQNVAEILIKNTRYDDALAAGQAISNPMKRAQVLQAILRMQEEKTRGPRKDVAPFVPMDETPMPTPGPAPAASK